MSSFRPTPLLSTDDRFDEQELGDLKSLATAGLPVTEILVVPAALEQEFYRLNNLNARLVRLFREIDISDPDDDDLEDLAPEAERLVEAHYLLDEFIDDFYAASEMLPELVRVRRAGESGLSSSRGRQSLLAVKRLWVRDWGFASLWRRLSGGGPLLPAARPLLIHGAKLEPMSEQLHRDAAASLGRNVELLGDPGSGIATVRETA